MAEHICIDLDGTLAEYTTWKGVEHIGNPIPKMVERVKRTLSSGMEVRIMTARVAPLGGRDVSLARSYTRDWCLKHLGQELPVVCYKDFETLEIWDDRAKQVIINTGVFIEDLLSGKDSL